jgi:probable HAF family extracellular repeat protein
MFHPRAFGAMLLRRSVIRLAFAPLAVLAAGEVAHAGLAYTVTPLGTLPGDSESLAFAINNAGNVVGLAYGYSPAPQQTFVYSGGALQPLGVTPAIASDYGINAAGQIVGGASPVAGSSASEAFLYAAGTVQYFPALAGAVAINASGQFVGLTNSSTSADSHAALYSGGQVHDLGTLGGSYSNAFAINSAGQVVGTAEISSGDDHAFLYSNGTMQDLGTLGGLSSIAQGINDHGQIAGASLTPAGDEHAFLYSNGTMQDLGTLGSGSYTYAFGINNSGVVVGDAVVAGGTSHGFVYTGGTMYDLNSLLSAGSGYQITDATAINDSGQIAASASNSYNEYEAVLLTPTSIPLPTSAWAAFTVLPLLLWGRRFVRGLR